MRSLRRPASVFIALALAGGLVACGDDDDEEATGGQTTTTEAEATASDAVDITMTEYAYAISGDLKPGGTIRLSNVGQEFHMMGLLKLKEGKTIADVTALLQEEGGGEEEGPTTTAAGTGGETTTTAAGTGGETTTTAAGAGGEEEGGEEEDDPFLELGEEVGAPGAFQGPGQRAEITVPTLGEGTYAMICFIPTEGGGPPHFAQGMIGQLTVAGEKATEPTADATFVMEPGKPITGPSTLTAGRHVLKFQAQGDADELEPGFAKLNAGAAVADVNRAFETFEGEDFVLPANAASLIPAQIIAAIFDFGPAEEIYVGVDLTAGTYGIDAHDSDVDDPPVDPVEKITFTVT